MQMKRASLRNSWNESDFTFLLFSFNIYQNYIEIMAKVYDLKAKIPQYFEKMILRLW